MRAAQVLNAQRNKYFLRSTAVGTNNQNRTTATTTFVPNQSRLRSFSSIANGTKLLNLKLRHQYSLIASVTGYDFTRTYSVGKNTLNIVHFNSPLEVAYQVTEADTASFHDTFTYAIDSIL